MGKRFGKFLLFAGLAAVGGAAAYYFKKKKDDEFGEDYFDYDDLDDEDLDDGETSRDYVTLDKEQVKTKESFVPLNESVQSTTEEFYNDEK